MTLKLSPPGKTGLGPRHLAHLLESVICHYFDDDRGRIEVKTAFKEAKLSVLCCFSPWSEDRFSLFAVSGQGRKLHNTLVLASLMALPNTSRLSAPQGMAM